MKWECAQHALAKNVHLARSSGGKAGHACQGEFQPTASLAALRNAAEPRRWAGRLIAQDFVV